MMGSRDSISECAHPLENSGRLSTTFSLVIQIMTHPSAMGFPRATKAAAVEAHFGSSIVECEGSPQLPSSK